MPDCLGEMEGEIEIEAGPALGAVLAGGRSSRIGRAKATIELAGRPMIAYPLAALEAAGVEAVVVAKPDSELPALDCPVVREPELPHHPLCGIVAALRAASGRAVIAIACDTPLIDPALLAHLATAADSLLVPDLDGRPQPLPARYGPDLRPHLEAALAREEPLRRTVESLSPRLLRGEELSRFGDPERLLLNVNDEEGLGLATALIRARSAASQRPSRRR